MLYSHSQSTLCEREYTIKSIIQNALLGVAVAFIILGPGIPNMSVPGIGEIQGVGQVAHADFWDFIDCVDESPSVGWGTRTACGLLAISTAFLGTVTILTTALKMLVKFGWKKAAKYLEDIPFKFPKKVMGKPLPKSVAGKTITLTLVTVKQNRTLQVISLVLMKSIYDLTYDTCKCLILGRY